MQPEKIATNVTSKEELKPMRGDLRKRKAGETKRCVFTLSDRGRRVVTNRVGVNSRRRDVKRSIIVRGCCCCCCVKRVRGRPPCFPCGAPDPTLLVHKIYRVLPRRARDSPARQVQRSRQCMRLQYTPLRSYIPRGTLRVSEWDRRTARETVIL